MEVIINSAVFDAMPRLSREMIAAETDAAKLARWYDALTEKIAELSAFTKAMNEAGLDMDGAAGKCAFCAIAARWIKNRLIAIGHPVPVPPTDPRVHELQRQQRRINRLKQQVRDLGGDPADSLSPHFENEASA